jgi:hypothetical protein
MDQSVAQDVADIDDPVLALSDFRRGAMASYRDLDMLFEINPEDDDNRRNFEVRFTSQSSFDKLVASAKMQRLDKISQTLMPVVENERSSKNDTVAGAEEEEGEKASKKRKFDPDAENEESDKHRARLDQLAE